MHAIAIIQTKESISSYRNISCTISKVAGRLVVASTTIQHGTVTIVYKVSFSVFAFLQTFWGWGRRDLKSAILCLCPAFDNFLL